MSDVTVLILVLVVLVAAGLGIWGFLRHRYVASLRAKGWQFITSPDISIVYGLNVAPFGMGFDRRVDDQLLGAASDTTPFSAFRYRCTTWRSSGYVVVMPLPHSLPPADISHVIAAAGSALRGPWDIHIDHRAIVLADAPKDADELATAIEDLAAVRTALLASDVAALRWPEPPSGLSFCGHPEWAYIPRDDAALNRVDHTGTGYDHQAHDIIVCDSGPLPFVRLRHTWKTRHTRTDSDGRTHTEVRNHDETLCEFRTAFPFQDLSVNWKLFGRSHKFEWEEFNRRFAVRSSDARFASDVIHQRQMEYLMQADPPKFEITRLGEIRIADGGDWLPDDIDRASAFLHGFFARVPNFVWQNLGAWPRPVAELNR